MCKLQKEQNLLEYYKDRIVKHSKKKKVFQVRNKIHLIKIIKKDNLKNQRCKKKFKKIKIKMSILQNKLLVKKISKM